MKDIFVSITVLLNEVKQDTYRSSQPQLALWKVSENA
jgi:hypothetical protein